MVLQKFPIIKYNYITLIEIQCMCVSCLSLFMWNFIVCSQAFIINTFYFVIIEIDIEPRKLYIHENYICIIFLSYLGDSGNKV